MPSQIETRQTEALEAIAQALQAHLHPEPLVPTHRTKADKSPVVAVHEPDEVTKQPSTSWTVTSENPATGQRKTTVVSAKDFAATYQPLNAELLPPEPVFEYRNKVTQEVVKGSFATDGDTTDVIVSHADGRPDERLKAIPFKAADDLVAMDENATTTLSGGR